MFDRRWLGDISLAVLLALPTAVLARPYADVNKDRAASSAPHVQVAAADHSATQSRFRIPG